MLTLSKRCFPCAGPTSGRPISSQLLPLPRLPRLTPATDTMGFKDISSLGKHISLITVPRLLKKCQAAGGGQGHCPARVVTVKTDAENLPARITPGLAYHNS